MKNPKHAKNQERDAQSEDRFQSIHVSQSNEGKNGARESQKKSVEVMSGTGVLEDGLVPFHDAFRIIHEADVLFDELDDRRHVGLAPAATGQTFAKVNRAFRAETLAARLAGADGLPVLMIKATHKNCGSG